MAQKNHIYPIDRTNFPGRLPFVKICDRRRMTPNKAKIIGCVAVLVTGLTGSAQDLNENDVLAESDSFS